MPRWCFLVFLVVSALGGREGGSLGLCQRFCWWEQQSHGPPVSDTSSPALLAVPVNLFETIRKLGDVAIPLEMIVVEAFSPQPHSSPLVRGCGLSTATRRETTKDIASRRRCVERRDGKLLGRWETLRSSISIVGEGGGQDAGSRIDFLDGQQTAREESGEAIQVIEGEGVLVREATLIDPSVSSAQVTIDHYETVSTDASDETSDTTSTENHIPSYRKMIVFAFTTMLIWLSEPLLSLVDTAVVGVTQQGPLAVAQLASLGPATTLIDSLFYMTYFLAIATTNRIAQELAVKDYRKLQTTTSHVLGVATVLGLLSMVFVFGLGPALLKSMAGESAVAAPEMVVYATKYSWIRATASVSSVVGVVAQSFCLATLDTRTPAVAVAAASIVNLIGDFALCPWLGVQGAAIATASSTVVSTWVLMRAVRHKMREWRNKEREENARREVQLSSSVPRAASGTGPDGSSSENESLSSATIENQAKVGGDSGAVQSRLHSVAVDGHDAGVDAAQSTTSCTEAGLVEKGSNKKKRPVPLLSLPDRGSFVQLLRLSGPISFVILAKIMCYSAMTLRCTEFGVIPLAAHNIMMRVFFFFSCSGDAISQTAQSYLPAALMSSSSSSRKRRDFGIIFKRLLVMSAFVGIVNSRVCVWIIKNVGQFLTQEMQIVHLMREHSGFLGVALLLHPLILLMEGTLMSSRDFKTLVLTYVATLGMHFSILKFFSGSFPAVWRTFFFFQTIRLGNFGFCVWQKHRAMRKEEREQSASPNNAVAAVASS